MFSKVLLFVACWRKVFTPSKCNVLPDYDWFIKFCPVLLIFYHQKKKEGDCVSLSKHHSVLIKIKHCSLQHCCLWKKRVEWLTTFSHRRLFVTHETRTIFATHWSKRWNKNECYLWNKVNKSYGLSKLVVQNYCARGRCCSTNQKWYHL